MEQEVIYKEKTGKADPRLFGVGEVEGLPPGEHLGHMAVKPRYELARMCGNKYFPHPMSPERLHIITCVSNPLRYQSRIDLYRKFARQMAQAGVHLITVEGALGERPFEVTHEGNPDHVQVRLTDEIWHKENLLNLGMKRLPADAKYVGWFDSDITPTNQDKDWPAEIIHQLQHYQVVQCFRDVIDLGPEGEVLRDSNGLPLVWTSFGYLYATKGIIPNAPYSKQFGHSGYCWAARRECLDQVGGLLDRAILGAADHHMALGIVGAAAVSVPGLTHTNYDQMVMDWQERAQQAFGRNLGWVDLTWHHGFHGKKKDRRYIERWSIIQQHRFDPQRDIAPDTQGVLRLTRAGLRMRDDLRRYFRQRNEDSIDTE